MADFTSLFGRSRTQKSWNTGIIITHAWKGDIPQEDYWRLLYDNVQLQPDTYNTDGIPVFRPTESALRRGQRLLDRECLDRYEVHNVACNAGRSNVLNYIGNIIGQGIKYFAVGNGSGTPASSDTALSAELFRKVPTSITLTGNQILISTNFLTTEANYTYTEAGLFGGSAATTTASSGTLFAHSAYNYTKTSSVSLTTSYYIYLN